MSSSAAHNEFRRYVVCLRSVLWWAAVDSNHLPPRYQHGALPVELAARLAGAEGFEPSALGFGDRCSDQTELRPYRPNGILTEGQISTGSVRLASRRWQLSSRTSVSMRHTLHIRRYSRTGRFVSCRSPRLVRGGQLWSACRTTPSSPHSLQPPGGREPSTLIRTSIRRRRHTETTAVVPAARSASAMLWAATSSSSSPDFTPPPEGLPHFTWSAASTSIGCSQMSTTIQAAVGGMATHMSGERGRGRNGIRSGFLAVRRAAACSIALYGSRDLSSKSCSATRSAGPQIAPSCRRSDPVRGRCGGSWVKVGSGCERPAYPDRRRCSRRPRAALEALKPYPASEWRTIFLGDLVDYGLFG